MSNQTIKSGDVSGDVTGTGASGVIAKEIHGDVFHIIINSEKVEEQLDRLNQITTEVDQAQAAGVDGNIHPVDSKQLQQSINELLEILKTSGLPVRNNNEIRAGELHLSQVDLLLKKAILIKAEADQMYLDQLGDNRFQAGSQQLTAGGGMRARPAGFDEEKHDAILKEAFKLLEEANQLDPANTEVLLHMAKLLMELTPDDPSDEQRLLYRIQKLINNPKNDVERFRLAQATFLIATSSNPLNESLLYDARCMFEKLGRTEWVRQCDEIINSNVSHLTNNTQQNFFQPVGYWHIYVADFLGSTMQLMLHANGYFETTQHIGVYGTIAQASGQWAYIPRQQMIYLQGLVNQIQPFMLGIRIQYQQSNIFYGIGTDGYNYTLQKT